MILKNRELRVNKDTKDKYGRKPPEKSDKYIINDRIRAINVMLIDHEGNNVGVISRIEALKLAEKNDLDLVQLGEKDGMPVTKLIDFDKYRYDKERQAREAKKKQKIVQIKEVKLRPSIDNQDYETKLKQAEKFFREGKKVKFTLQFRGRQIGMMNELGPQMFARITNDLSKCNLGTLIEEKETRGRVIWTKIFYIKS